MVGAAAWTAAEVRVQSRGTDLPDRVPNSKPIAKGISMSHTNSGETGTASALMERVRDGASSQLTTQKGRVTDSLTSLAQAVRQSTESLRSNQQPAVAQYVEKAASQLEHLSNRLRDRDVKDLVQDAQQYARRQPAIFVGAAFAAGLLAARFMKSSSNTQNGRGFAERNEHMTPQAGPGSR
jgi:ElaB/YqjD/DUF883 family membrane-anchored ribosome-binding protein